MPIVAWIDERHLPPLGLAQCLGLQSRHLHGARPAAGAGRHRRTARHRRGTACRPASASSSTSSSTTPAKATRLGPTLSLRGLDKQAYYRHEPEDPGVLVNDTGTGNTIACDSRPACDADPRCAAPFRASCRRRRLPLRPRDRARPGRPRLRAATRRCCRRSSHDPVLAGRVLIAEPWDIGPGGYQLGNFPPPFLEWNDRFRDDVRRFWRGDREHDRSAGDAACRFVRYLPAGRAADDALRQFHRRP